MELSHLTQPQIDALRALAEEPQGISRASGNGNIAGGTFRVLEELGLAKRVIPATIHREAEITKKGLGLLK